jgi:hypothetical protein
MQKILGLFLQETFLEIGALSLQTCVAYAWKLHIRDHLYVMPIFICQSE